MAISLEKGLGQHGNSQQDSWNQLPLDNLGNRRDRLGGLLMGAGLLVTKDAKVIGAGTLAKTVHSDGEVKNVEGEQVSKQPAVVPPVIERPIQ